MTDFSDWFAAQDKIGAARTATALSSDPRSPDELANHAKIGAQLGLPPIVVGSDPAAYKARAQQKSMIEALSEAPKTAAWLKNRDNGGIAKDDVENLGWFEQGLKDFSDMGDNPASRGVARGLLSMGGNLKGMAAIQSGITAADIGLSQEQLISRETSKIPKDLQSDPSMQYAAQLAGAAKYDAISGMTEDDRAAMLKGAADQLAQSRALMGRAAKLPRSETGQAFLDNAWAKADHSFMGVVGAIAEDPIGAAAFIGDTAAESLPALVPAAIATAVSRNPTVGAAVMGGTSGITTASSEAMGFLDQHGVKLETPEDVAALFANRELMVEAQKYGVTKGLIVGALDALSGKVAGTALSASPAGNMALQTVAQAALGAGGEALAEAATDGSLDWKQIIVEGLAELVTAPAEVISMGHDWLKTTTARKAEGRAREVLQAADEKAAASKVKARSPDAFNSAMEHILGGKSVYVPADGLATYFQAKDMSFDPADWGIDANAFEAAAALTGGKVAIPASVYASKISGTEDAAWVHENATATIDSDMSSAEASEFDKAKADWLHVATIEQDRVFAEEQAARPVETAIYETMLSRNLAAGQSSDVAASNSILWPKFFSTMAARSGVGINELTRRYALPLIEGAIPHGVHDRGGVRRALLGNALDVIRKNGPVRDMPIQQQIATATREMHKAYPETKQAKPFTYAMKARGGIQYKKNGVLTPIAAELESRGITPKTARGLFREGGMADVDNIPASEVFKGPSVIAEDGNGYLSRDAVIDAIEREARGEKVPLSLDAQLTMNDVAALGEGATDPFSVDGWRDVKVKVDLDNGKTAEMTAGEAHSVLSKRIEDANDLIRCLNG